MYGNWSKATAFGSSSKVDELGANFSGKILIQGMIYGTTTNYNLRPRAHGFTLPERTIVILSLACFSKGSVVSPSFIHYGDLYSAPSRLLLRSAPDPCTAKKKSFET